MWNSSSIVFASPTRWAALRLLAGGLAVLCLVLIVGGSAQAAPAAPATQGDATAVQVTAMPLEDPRADSCGCHSMETATWQASPHAKITADGKPVATCEDCHGAYVRGHPDQGVIPLKTDSAVCTDCHTKTAGEWQGTVHAEAGIQCISCHVSHSQDLRVDSDKLCQSCHRDSLDDALHTAHWVGGTTCTSCHLSDSKIDSSQSLASTDPMAVLMGAPRHDFVTVSTKNCLDCHQKAVTGTSATPSKDYAVRQELLKTVSEVPQLRAQLDTAEQQSRTMTLMNPISLGLGISLGGLLGIVFMLAMVRFSRPKGGGPL